MILSFDAEANGLYGQAFALGAVIVKSNKIVDEFQARCPIQEPVDPWVAENVLPVLLNMEVTHKSYEGMLNSFYDFYMKYKESTFIAHIAHPVETKVLRDMVQLDLKNRVWDGPLITDVHQELSRIGEDPWSVDDYIKKYNIEVPYKGSPHHPLYDAHTAAAVYQHINRPTI